MVYPALLPLMAHTSATSSRLIWRPRRFKWTRPFRRKTKSGFCACAITFQTQSTTKRIKHPLVQIWSALTWNKIRNVSIPWQASLHIWYKSNYILKVFFYPPTDAQVNFLRNNFKTYIKIDTKSAPTRFGAITIIREHRNMLELF
jgi:hypothetical protein